MTEKPQLPSIHDIPLPTTGGIPARKGFDLQDHVAVSYCIQMIDEVRIMEVWNEAHEDVTLIWKSESSEEVEFIQVKGTEHDQLWSFSLLCQRNSSVKEPAGTSVFERSLSRHACAEPCRFRIVTSRDIKEELRPLTHPLNEEARKQSENELNALSEKLVDKMKDVRSPSGSDGSYWISHTVWQVVHTLEALKAKSMADFERKLEKLGYYLLSDQRDELYQKLVKKLWDAAKEVELSRKTIRRAELLAWLPKAVSYFSNEGVVGGQRVREKMEAAKLPEDAIVAAAESRMRYRTTALTARYSAPAALSSVEGELSAKLSTLRARLDAGVYDDDGPSFYSRCLDTLEEFHQNSAPARQLGLDFLQGCMYSMMDRCAHRLTRVSQ